MDIVTTAYDNEQSSVLAAALEAYDAGLTVIRCRIDGSKAPRGDEAKRGEWQHWQNERPDRDTVRRWFVAGYPGVGIVTTSVEMFEFEGSAVAEGMFDEFEELVADNGLSEVWERIYRGWMETTPSGGVHVYYRIEDTPPASVKLALRPKRDELGEVVRNGRAPVYETLVETKGSAGGFSIIAPSHGPVHPSGKPYLRTYGGPATMTTITSAERDALHALAAVFDEHIVEEPPEGVVPASDPLRVRSKESGDGWIDGVVEELDRRPWAEVLGRYGWAELRTSPQGVTMWRRPGKSAGVSATTNAKGTDRFINFSSSVPQFEPAVGKGARSYDRLDVIAIYDYAGDRVEAARDIDPAAARRYREKMQRIELPPKRAQAELDDAELVEGDDEELDDGPVLPPPKLRRGENLPEEFWGARPWLGHIRQAAWARMMPADAVFGAVLARAALLIDYRILIPAIVSREGTLNLSVGIVGGSGDGKGTAIHIAGELLPEAGLAPDYRVKECPAGSGEGITAAFLERCDKEDGKGTEWRQTVSGVLLRIDEGEVLSKLGERSGATMWQVWRQGWSGEALGFSNASEDRKRPVIPAYSYRLCGIVAVQPGLAGPMLKDTAGGTAQRFLWLSGYDAELPEDDDGNIKWPGPLRWTPPSWNTPESAVVDVSHYRRRLFEVDPSIVREVRAWRRARIKGELVGDDGHRMLSRLKVAGVLAALDGRLNIGPDDWRLAGIVLDTSEVVRESLAQADRNQAELVARGRIEHAGRRAEAEEVGRTKAANDLVRVAERIRHYVARKADLDGVSRKDIRSDLGSRDRVFLDAALALAEARGFITEWGNRYFPPPPETPSNDDDAVF